MQYELGILVRVAHHYFSDFGRDKLIFEANFRGKKGVLMGKLERGGLVLPWKRESKGVEWVLRERRGRKEGRV